MLFCTWTAGPPDGRRGSPSTGALGRAEHTDRGWSHQRSADSHRLHLRSQRPLHEAAFTTRRRPVCSAQPPAPDRPLPAAHPPPGPSAHMPQRAEVHLAGGLFRAGPARCLWPRSLSRAAPTPRRLEAACRPRLEKPWFSPQACRRGAGPVSVSSALPLWKNGSIGALKLTSSSESTVEFKRKCFSSLGRDCTLVLGSTHPRLQPRQIHQPPLRLTERRCNLAQLFAEEVRGRKRHQISSSQLTDALPPPPPRGDVFIASFTALHRRQITWKSVSIARSHHFHDTQNIKNGVLSVVMGVHATRPRAWAPRTQSRSQGKVFCKKQDGSP